MFIEITRNNLDELTGTLLTRNEVEHELNINPFGKYLIFKEDNQVIGYIYYSDIYERSEINQFEIEDSHRNCGKGKILLQEFLKLVEKDVTLEVKKDNYPAIHLYKSNGFVEKAIRPGYYQGIDGILMEKQNNK